MSNIESAIEILRKTQDGEDLSPTHLRIVEAAANNLLNEAGIQELGMLLQQVQKGEYKKPCYSKDTTPVRGWHSIPDLAI